MVCFAILDTNFVLDYHKLIKEACLSLSQNGDKKLRFIVPYVVLQELDKLKVDLNGTTTYLNE